MKLNRLFLVLLMLLVFANVVSAEECQYKINMDYLMQLQSRDKYHKMANIPSTEADDYIKNMRQQYEACVANQTDKPYEETVCDGDSNCVQRYDLNQQYVNSMNNYSDAIKNQHIKIDANVNHSGTVNYNNYNYNRYRYYRLAISYLVYL